MKQKEVQILYQGKVIKTKVTPDERAPLIGIVRELLDLEDTENIRIEFDADNGETWDLCDLYDLGEYEAEHDEGRHNYTVINNDIWRVYADGYLDRCVYRRKHLAQFVRQ